MRTPRIKPKIGRSFHSAAVMPPAAANVIRRSSFAKSTLTVSRLASNIAQNRFRNRLRVFLAIVSVVKKLTEAHGGFPAKVEKHFTRIRVVSQAQSLMKNTYFFALRLLDRLQRAILGESQCKS